MLKILQTRLQQYVAHEIPDVQTGFRKGRGTRDQIANICWVIERAREFQKNIYFCFIDYTKAFDCVNHNELWKILQEMGIPDHLICLLRNLYAGQEATELDMEQQTGSNLGKEYLKAVYGHLACLMYIQSTSSEKAIATNSSTLDCKVPWMRSLVGCSPWGRKVLDVTKQLPFHFSLPLSFSSRGSLVLCFLP